MTITADELAEIREWIGSAVPPSDGTLEEWFGTLGSTAAVARRVVRQRLADLRATAAKFTAEGDYSEDWSANIATLERLERTLASAVTAATAADGTGTLTTGLLTRADRCR